jgi:azurin
MKRIYVYVFAAAFFAASCGQNESSKNNQADDSKTPNAVETMETSVPGVEKLNFSDTVQLSVNQNMVFDKELFRVKVGKKIRLIVKNTSAKSTMSMVHNVVVLNKGTDIADFAEVARLAKTEQYVPSSLASSIIAYTKTVSGGESDEVEFTIPQAGVYDFICSFPGHWGTMQGKIVAE